MTDKKFKFSVIIPIYNVEDYLEETIESVVNQTVGFEDNIELILINDGSPDNSERICLKYKEKYADNIIYYKKENGGVSSARNKGLELATGELINFLDSDDIWSLDTFEKVYNAYQKNKDISLFSCKMQFFDGKKGNHPLNYKYIEEKVVNILEEYEYPQLSSSSIFINKEATKGHKFNEKIKYKSVCKIGKLYGKFNNVSMKITYEKQTNEIIEEDVELKEIHEDDTAKIEKLFQENNINYTELD